MNNRALVEEFYKKNKILFDDRFSKKFIINTLKIALKQYDRFKEQNNEAKNNKNT